MEELTGLLRKRIRRMDWLAENKKKRKNHPRPETQGSFTFVLRD